MEPAQRRGWRDWSRRYTPAVGWAAPERVESGEARYKSQRALVVDDAGNAVTVWSQGESRHYGLWANRYTPEVGWGAEQRIDAIDSLNAKYPSVVGDREGNVIAVWSDQEPEGYRQHMWASRYSPGAGWGPSELIESSETSDASWPSVAMDPDGNAIAVWEETFGTHHDIYANRYTRGSGWGIAAPIENEHISSDFDPEVAMDDGATPSSSGAGHRAMSTATIETSGPTTTRRRSAGGRRNESTRVRNANHGMLGWRSDPTVELSRVGSRPARRSTAFGVAGGRPTTGERPSSSKPTSWATATSRSRRSTATVAPWWSGSASAGSASTSGPTATRALAAGRPPGPSITTTPATPDPQPRRRT